MSNEKIISKILTSLTFVCIVLFVIILLPKENESVKIEVKSPFRINVSVDNEIVEMDFEEYLVHVVAGEMYADYHIEALKAQAVTARTYTYRMLMEDGCNKEGADICDDINDCQAFAKTIPDDVREKMEKAVYDTAGEIITYNSEPILALFHSTSGGYTEDNVNVFGKDLPYLKSVESKGEENSRRYSQQETFTVDEIKKKTNTKGSHIVITERLNSGRVRSVNVFGKVMSGKELREAIGLSSANFTVKIDGEKVVFTTIGYGHGVGLSQVGANAMANSGSKYHEIIKHYYTGVEISKM